LEKSDCIEGRFMASYRQLAANILMLSGLLSIGCSTPNQNPLHVFAPYRGAPMGEDLRSPPTTDPRYTQPPTYPPALLKPVAKVKDEDSGTGLKRAPIGSPGMSMPGNASSMGGPGGF
jgi:hypothetical protein